MSEIFTSRYYSTLGLKAEVYVENIIGDSVKKFKIYFKTSKNNGTVYLTSDKNPIEMSFEDNKFSFKGHVSENICE